MDGLYREGHLGDRLYQGLEEFRVKELDVQSRRFYLVGTDGC